MSYSLAKGDFVVEWDGPNGAVQVRPVQSHSRAFECSSGFVCSWWKDATLEQRKGMLLVLFANLIAEGVQPIRLLRAFRTIEEFQTMLDDGWAGLGCG